MDVLTTETCWALNNEIIVFSLHPDTTPPQPNHTVTPTHIEPEQYNPWNNSTNKSQAPEDGCINIWNMLSIKYWNNKASDIKLVSLYSTIKMMHDPINIKLNVLILNILSQVWFMTLIRVITYTLLHLGFELPCSISWSSIYFSVVVEVFWSCTSFGNLDTILFSSTPFRFLRKNLCIRNLYVPPVLADNVFLTFANTR